MITEYNILQDVNIHLLQERIAGYITDGWQPLGGISTTSVKLNIALMPDNNGAEQLHYTQAMVR